MQTNGQIIEVNISELKPNPENEKIYGNNEDVKLLQKSILEEGLRDHIIINENNVILSGHRRWQAYKNLANEGHAQYNKISCQVVHFDNAEDELEYLIRENDDSTKRVKTEEQIARELAELKKIEAIRSKGRMSLGGKGGVDKNNEGRRNVAHLDADKDDTDTGRTRDIIYQKYKDTYNLKSSHDVDDRIKAVETVDKLKEDGKAEKAELIINILNQKKTSQAAKLARNIDKIPDEVIHQIADGVKSVNQAIKECTDTKDSAPKETSIDVSVPDKPTITRWVPYYMPDFYEMSNMPLVKKIYPVVKLDFWKKLRYFTNVDNPDSETTIERIIYAILSTLALITEADVWLDMMYGGDSENDIYEHLFDFAQSININENEETIENLINLYVDFDKVIIKIADSGELSEKDWKFFDECNLPHMIYMLDYFRSKKRQDISFVKLLTDFVRYNRTGYESSFEFF